MGKFIVLHQVFYPPGIPIFRYV